VSAALRRAESVLRAACGERVRTTFPMAPLTTFRIGGPAAIFLEPETESDLVAASEAVRSSRVPFVVIGKGSNLLVSDDGFPGLVLRLGRGFRFAARDGARISAGGAMPLPALAGVALAHALRGLEWGAAIPASLGGAVRMNAGAHGADMAAVLEEVELFRLETGATEIVPAAAAGFRYRGSSLAEDGIVTRATVALAPGEVEEIRARMDEVREWRRRTQPLAEPNCGSVFKNPPGDHAARLIEAAGGKGLRVGGAQVSVKHANFVVTSEGARAADVVALIRSVQELVAAHLDVWLEPEVHLVGDFERTPR
jgi:UDP-N-acetylmuramate dehydrogenase